MERVAELTAIVAREVADYANARDWKARSFFVADLERHIYAVIGIPDMPRPFPSQIDVMARVVGDKVVIEEDITDRPLYEALLQAGIPRHQLILVYAGDPLPDTQ